MEGWDWTVSRVQKQKSRTGDCAALSVDARRKDLGHEPHYAQVGGPVAGCALVMKRT